MSTVLDYRPVVNAFSGSWRTLARHATLKWTPSATPGAHAFKLQAEYMRRTEDGALHRRRRLGPQ